MVAFLTRNSRLVRLAPRPSLAEGRNSSGGGVRLTAEMVSVNGRAHICNAYADLAGQIERTKHLGREILRSKTVRQAGKTVLSDPSGLRRVRARADYSGVDATCLDSDRFWTARNAGKALTLQLPNQIVYRSIKKQIPEVIRFHP